MVWGPVTSAALFALRRDDEKLAEIVTVSLLAVGLVGFLLSSISLGAFTWHRLPIYRELRRILVTLLVAAGGGVIVGLVGLSITMVVGYSLCG